MPEEEKSLILERQPWRFIFSVLLFALCVGVLLWGLYKNPELNLDVQVQRIEARE